ncbi:methyl-accepting chemotaxis protein [Rubritepida flocculans]|uniref:methyl-accepting chemotaxis protein n=1 Tax=Rubritepida flocculans TaxID=182403 RepID=UPI000415F74B|nr:methyl-accepting chemotaxis protein [Rubritepida flocculans]
MDLSLIRARTGRALLILLAVLVAAAPPLGWLSGTGQGAVMLGGGIGLAMLAAALLAARQGLGGPAAAASLAVGLMAAISVHVWFAPAWLRPDMHMAYFAGLALLAGFCAPAPILVATVTVALHHLVLNFAAPMAVFGVAEGSLVRVALHAAVLLAEAGGLLLLIGLLRRGAAAADAALAEAERARAAEAQAAAARAAAEAEAARAAREARHALADRVEQEIGGVAAGVERASDALEAASRRIAAGAAGALEGAQAARLAVQEASAGVQTVAAASEELAAAVAEITRQVETANAIAGTAAERAAGTRRSVQGLAEGAARIGEVLRLIGDVAGRTNLLALNATIEAARAGEAGKGFAVVASEVKDLAGQTAKATEEIAAQVQGIRAATEEAMAAIEGIAAVVGEVNQAAGTIAAAVAQQGAATREIAAASAQVARGAEAAAASVGRALDEAQQTAEATGEVERMAGALRGDAGALREALAGTVAGLRAA